ncbi:hypothetical protein TNCV_250811 [Trichonephila clavipes]|nr:hypothetical protein TNCV_250811 [Trichonephila clavipes]
MNSTKIRVSSIGIYKHGNSAKKASRDIKQALGKKTVNAIEKCSVGFKIFSLFILYETIASVDVSRHLGGYGSIVVKVSDRGWHVTSLTKNRRVGQRCTLNLSRAKTSSRWCGVVVRREGF